MTCFPVLLFLSISIPGQTQLQDVINAARDTQKKIGSYHVYGRVKVKTHTAAVPPHRTQKITPPVLERYARPDIFEDRFDSRFGRSRLKFIEGQVAPIAAQICKVTSKETALSELKFRNTCDDLLWVLNPSYSEFSLLETLESNPNSRLTKFKNLYVLEIPPSTMQEYREFGARLFIDASRGYTITGFDVYVAVDGHEELLTRVDIELRQVFDAWWPTRILAWKRLGLLSESSSKSSAQTSEVIIDMKRSRFGIPLKQHEITLTKWSKLEEHRSGLTDNWVQILYRNPPSEGFPVRTRSSFFPILLGLNLGVLVIIITCWAWRRRAHPDK